MAHASRWNACPPIHPNAMSSSTAGSTPSMTRWPTAFPMMAPISRRKSPPHCLPNIDAQTSSTRFSGMPGLICEVYH